MEETHYLPANEPHSSRTRRMRSQTLQLKEFLGSHQFKIRLNLLVLSIALATTIIIIIIISTVFVVFRLWRTKEPSAGPCLNDSCPEGWVGYQGRCYYFSETEGTWDFGQRNCSSYGASLTAIDAPWELNFLMRFKGHEDHWIGLCREDTEEPWKWADGSTFSNWFNITADGLCIYLRNGASSTWCDMRRRWICRKP